MKQQLTASFHDFAVSLADDPSQYHPVAGTGRSGLLDATQVRSARSGPMWKVFARSPWSLRMFALPYCPPEDLRIIEFGHINTTCAAFHQAAVPAIRALHPKLLVITGQTISEQSAPGVFYTTSQWKEGLVRTIDALKQTGTRIVVIGNIPEWTNDGADCLAAHETDVQACMVPLKQGIPVNEDAEREAAQVTGTDYIDTAPWVCTRMCVPVVGI